MTTFTVTLRPSLTLTDEQFEQLAHDNREIKFERTATGELLIMPPTGGETGNRNFELYGPFWAWNASRQLGFGFDSSTAFKLPNGAIRSPDLAWVQRVSKAAPKELRWQALSLEQRQTFPPLCPDFVLELRSASVRAACPQDLSLQTLQEKMQEYLDNGAQLGWLINPKERQVEIYQPTLAVEVLESPITLSGEAVLQGFVLDLRLIFEL